MSARGAAGAGSPATRGLVRPDVLDLGARPLLIIWCEYPNDHQKGRAVYASSLIKVVRCHLGAAGAPLAPPAAAPAPLREVLAARLADPRKPRGIRHSLGSLVPVLAAVALDPALAARVAARAAAGKKNSGGTSKRRRKPPAGQALREVHGDGWF